MTHRIEPTDDLRAAAHRDADTGPFFDALAEGRLLLRRCAGCGHHARPDAAGCPACHGADLVWSPSTGAGVVVSRVVDRTGEREGLLPVVLGIVELDEGPWLHARLLAAGATGEAPGVGEAVTLVVLVPTDGDGEPVPAFESAGSVGGMGAQ